MLGGKGVQKEFENTLDHLIIGYSRLFRVPWNLFCGICASISSNVRVSDVRERDVRVIEVVELCALISKHSLTYSLVPSVTLRQMIQVACSPSCLLV